MRFCFVIGTALPIVWNAIAVNAMAMAMPIWPTTLPKRCYFLSKRSNRPLTLGRTFFGKGKTTFGRSNLLFGAAAAPNERHVPTLGIGLRVFSRF